MPPIAETLPNLRSWTQNLAPVRDRKRRPATSSITSVKLIWTRFPNLAAFRKLGPTETTRQSRNVILQIKQLPSIYGGRGERAYISRKTRFPTGAFCIAEQIAYRTMSEPEHRARVR